MLPTKEWLEKYESVKETLACSVDLNTYFELPEIEGKSLTVMNIGPCTVPSGKLMVFDPLVYIGVQGNAPYYKTVPVGTYDTEVAVIKADGTDCNRYASVRLRFSENRPVKFYEALVGRENILEVEEDYFFGFPVDAGLGCICDAEVYKAFCEWSEKWNKEHPDGNHYDDYFEPLFAENYKKYPEYQREGGDWLNWQIPGTEYRVPIFQSGFGDGFYPVYWGVDSSGEICQIVIQFINIEFEYGEYDEDDEE